MRKIIAIGLILVMVVIGFTAMLNPVASDDPCGDVTIEKGADNICYMGGFSVEPHDFYIPLGTLVYWEMQIWVNNTHGHPIYNVRVKDRLGGELGVEDYWPQDGVTITTKGETEKVFIDWEIGTIPAHTSVMLTLLIYTDENPGGNQEYTSTGCYWMNSGATVKWWNNPDGNQDSASSNRLRVTVYGEEED